MTRYVTLVVLRGNLRN